MKRAVVLPDATFLLPSPYGIEKSQENLFLQGFYHPKCPTSQKDGRFTLFEMKFNPKKAAAKLPKAFMETYDVERTAVAPPELDGVAAIAKSPNEVPGTAWISTSGRNATAEEYDSRENQCHP